MLHKLRRTMVDPERDPLDGVVGIDETAITSGTADDPVARAVGRSHDGTIPVASAWSAAPMASRENPSPGHLRRYGAETRGLRPTCSQR